MPDIPTRSDDESALAAILLLALNKWKAEAIALLGDNPTAGRIPDSFYTGHAATVRRELTEFLTNVHAAGAERLAEQLTTTGQPNAAGPAAANADENIRRAREWAERRAAELSSELAEKVREQVEDAIRRYQEKLAASLANQEHTDEDREAAKAAAALILMGSLGTIFGGDRAEAIGATEITRANTAGEYSEAKRLSKLGYTLTAIWNCEDDPCPVCEQYDGESEDVWGDEFPEGPPSPHPHCRCYLEWQVLGNSEPSLN